MTSCPESVAPATWRNALPEIRWAVRTALMLAGILLIPVIHYFGQPGRLLYNTTWSMDKGLYWASHVPKPQYERGELVAYNYTHPEWIAERQWTHMPDHLQLVKRVIGIPGDRILRATRENGEDLYLCQNDQPPCELIATRLPSDRYGNPWPEFPASQLIPPDQVFLLADNPASYDSRYLGPLPKYGITSTLEKIWSTDHLQSFRDTASYGTDDTIITVPVPVYLQSSATNQSPSLKDRYELPYPQ